MKYFIMNCVDMKFMLYEIYAYELRIFTHQFPILIYNELKFEHLAINE